ncbi:MAG: manganese efflux pump MntP family protein [Bacillota bacterium]|jgi:putative Mn2+ efflux pump MntP
MSFIGLLIIAMALAVDVLVVTIAKGLALSRISWRKSITVGLYFGGFQLLMILLGYILTDLFSDKIEFIDHWIAFVLLVLIGLGMIVGSRKPLDQVSSSLAPCTMIVMAFAASIDALAMGASLSFLEVNIIMAAILIGLVAFLFSLIGLRVGKIFAVRYKIFAEIAGGLVLIILGCKILFDHLLGI